MALQKTKALNDGTSGNYWHIVELNLNVLTLTAKVSMGLWIDAGHYAAHAAPLYYPKQIIFHFQPVDMATGITPTYVYQKVLDYANTMVSPFGAPEGSQDVLADQDLAGATIVA